MQAFAVRDVALEASLAADKLTLNTGDWGANGLVEQLDADRALHGDFLSRRHIRSCARFDDS